MADFGSYVISNVILYCYISTINKDTETVSDTNNRGGGDLEINLVIIKHMFMSGHKDARKC